MPHWVWATAEFALSFGIVTLLFALIFKFLPDAKISWQNVWIGAAATAFLFEIGKQLLALYLGHQGSSSPYGAATSVILLLLWVYYASCILLFGAEFTQVYTMETCGRIEPGKFAVAAETHGGEKAHPEKEPVEPTVVSIPVYTPPPAPAYPHSLAEVPGFLKESPAAATLTALGCGYAVGLLARLPEDHSKRTAVQEIRHGARTLAMAAVPIGAHAIRQIWKEARRRLDGKSLWKAAFHLPR